MKDTESTRVDTMPSHVLEVASFGDHLPQIEVIVQPASGIVSCSQSPLRIQIQQTPDIIGCYVWSSAVVVSKYLLSVEGQAMLDAVRKGMEPNDLPIAVELGAGCGLCSMILALCGVHTLCTDVKPVLPLLSSNLRQFVSQCPSPNWPQHIIVSDPGSSLTLPHSSVDDSSVCQVINMTVSELNWNDEGELTGVGDTSTGTGIANSGIANSGIKHLQNIISSLVTSTSKPFSKLYPDIILCSDCLYSTGSVASLQNVIDQVLVQFIILVVVAEV